MKGHEMASFREGLCFKRKGPSCPQSLTLASWLVRVILSSGWSESFV